MLTTSDVVQFQAVSKQYRLRESRTLKEFLPSVLRGKAYEPEFLALRDVSFSLGKGQSLGIIGPNGSGKTTALRIIAGITSPTSGSVQVSGRVAPLIELGAGFHIDLTGRENIFMNGCILGMTDGQIKARLADIVDFAEIDRFVDSPVKHYSSGMFLRLAFSIAIHSNPDIMIVDEALAVGDLAFRDKCLARIRELRQMGVTMVLVSHSLDLVDDYCDRAILLRAGAKVTEGEPREVIDAYRSSVPRVDGVSGLHQ